MPPASAAPALLIATRPAALVTAPWPATIRYRGPLLDYGNVMIVEPSSGYLLVLAGLARSMAKPAMLSRRVRRSGLWAGAETDGTIDFPPTDKKAVAQAERKRFI